MEDWYDAEQLAQAWGMHVRTIRRYIREGKLQASKIGGTWRIAKEDAEVFVGRISKDIKKKTDDDIQSFIDEGKDKDGVTFEVCAVVEYPMGSKEAQLLSQHLVSIMNSDDPARGPAKMQFQNFPDEHKCRFVIWGKAAFVGKLLTTAAEHTE